MNHSTTPRSPKWPYWSVNATLLAAASYFVLTESHPLPTEIVIAAVVCVGLAALIGVVPYWLEYTSELRAHDAAIRARQESEAAKLHHAAEVIAGAASNLKSAQESTARALHAAESLPYRMQEKIGELTAQLQQLEDDDKAALEKEIELLRETEGEKLAGVAEKIRAATKEFTAVEKEMRPAIDAAVKQGRELEESLKTATTSARATLLSAEAKLKAAENHARAAFDAMEQNLQARLAELKQWEAANAAALASAAVATTAGAAAPRRNRTKPATTAATESETKSITDTAPASPAEMEQAASSNGHHEPTITPTPEVEAEVVTATVSVDAAKSETPAIAAAESAAPEVVAHTGTPAPSPSISEPASTETMSAPVAEPVRDSEEVSPTAVEAAAVVKVPAQTSRVPAPTSRRSERRAVGRLAAFPDTAVETADASEELAPVVDADSAPKREPRRRSVMRSVDDVALPGFADHEIVYDDALNAGTPTAAKTSDGTTRLLVTAYIGIGNKVFLRGEGPGLSWEKGVPLEFVSIGKWSWQASESAGPIRAHLYKNDETKALGEELVLEPGHHVEVRPIFREANPF